MQVSVIATVFNEARSIPRLLDSLADQSHRPDEVVICDGGSQDGTVALIEAYARQHADRLPALRVVVQPGANISQGRNRAIGVAQGPIIAVTDAGVRLSSTWLEKLVQPWAVNAASEPLAVAGFFYPDVHTLFTSALAATVLPLLDEINPQRFLPSSRSVAFTKPTWEKIGGYPEWLDYCEDLLFDFAVNAQQPDQPTAFIWVPEALVYFRPRENLAAFWTQYYRYARGDGKADLWRKRHLIRYLTYLVAFPALIGHGLWGTIAPGLSWIGLLLGLGIYCRRPWQRLRTLGKQLDWGQWLQAALLVPIIRIVGDGAKMVGYPVGLWWRWQQRTGAGRFIGVGKSPPPPFLKKEEEEDEHYMTQTKFSRRTVPANLIEATPAANGLGYWLLASPMLLFLGWLWVDLVHTLAQWPIYALSVLVGVAVYVLLIVLPLGYLAHRLVLLVPRLFQQAGWEVEPLEPVGPAEQYLVRYRFQTRQWATGGWSRAWLRAAQGWVFLEIAAILLGAVGMAPVFFSATEFGFGQ